MDATLPESAQPNGSAVTSADAVVLRDLTVFVLEKHPIIQVNGDPFYCPRSTYRKEQQILFMLKDMIVPLLKLGFLGGRDLDPEQTAQMMGLLLSQGPEKLSKAASILTMKDEEWVLDNLTIETIVGLIIPFFVSKWNSTRAVVAPLMGELATAAVNAGPTTPQ